MTAKITVFRDVMPRSYLSTKAHNTANQKAVISSHSLCMGTAGDTSYIFSDTMFSLSFFKIVSNESSAGICEAGKNSILHVSRVLSLLDVKVSNCEQKESIYIHNQGFNSRLR
jgi:hypothetical protein